jgi:hypothetical protein
VSSLDLDLDIDVDVDALPEGDSRT